MNKEDKEKTFLKDGITNCCKYDFGVDGFGKIKVKYCPICGKPIDNYINRVYHCKCSKLID